MTERDVKMARLNTETTTFGSDDYHVFIIVFLSLVMKTEIRL